MTELERALIADSAATPPSRILEAMPEDLIHRRLEHVPHTIFQELWHIAFWQEISVDWIAGRETPYPVHPSAGFASQADIADEAWDQLRARFFRTLDEAAAAARDPAHLEDPIRCPSRPGEPIRVMSVREQLESLAAHNAYHFGRIVLLRQLGSAWPPPTGGFTW